MIIGIQLPQGTSFALSASGKLMISFDENKTKVDLWKARFDIWVTSGRSESDFMDNELLDHHVLELTHDNKLKLQ